MMRKKLLAILAALALPATAIAQSNRTYNTNLTANFTRPCTPKPASAEEITSTSGASDTTTQMNALSVYWLKCDTAAYIDTSLTSSCTAASGDFPLPADTLFPILTTSAMRYMCARNVTTTGSCWIWECQ